MKVIELKYIQGVDCDECNMPDKRMIKFRNDFICLDCLDKALKMLLLAVEKEVRK